MKTKKFRNRLLFVLAAFALSFGAALSLKIKTPVVTKAVPVNSTKLYLKTNANWRVDGARFAAYFFTDGGANTWVDMEKEPDTDDIYFVISPAQNYDKIIFARMNPQQLANNWGNKWNQTGDLVYDGLRNLSIIPEGSWDGSTAMGVFGETPAEGITNDKVRLWLNRNSHYEDGYSYIIKLNNEYFAPTGHENALYFGVDSSRWFAYYDLPLSKLTGKTLTFIVINGNNETQYVFPNISFASGDNSKVWNVNFNAGNGTITKGAITDRIHNTFFAKVLEGYLTCSPSVDNGYGAFSALDANFLPRDGSNWNMEGDLGGITINDYLSESDYTTGNRTATVDAYVKYVALQTAAGAGSSRQLTHENSVDSTTTVLVLGSMFTVATAGYVFFRKKKLA